MKKLQRARSCEVILSAIGEWICSSLGSGLLRPHSLLLFILSTDRFPATYISPYCLP